MAVNLIVNPPLGVIPQGTVHCRSHWKATCVHRVELVLNDYCMRVPIKCTVPLSPSHNGPLCVTGI